MRQWLSRIGYFLIEPSREVLPEKRLRARLNSTVLLLISVATLLDLLTATSTGLVRAGIGLLISVSAYLLSRTRWYQWSGILTMIGLSGPILGQLLLPDADLSEIVNALMWLSIPILVASMVLETWQTVIATVLLIGAVCLIPISHPELGWDEVGNLISMLGTEGALLVMVSSLRSADARSLEESRKHEKQFAALQQSIFDGAATSMILTAPDGIITTWNKAAEDMLGYTSDEVLGKVTPAIIHRVHEIVSRAEVLTQELGTRIDPGFEAFIAKAKRGHIDTNEWTYVRKDGSTFPVQLSVSALRDDRGVITGYLGVATDISERKVAEIALTQTKEQLGSFLEAATEGIVVVNELGHIILVNAQVEQDFGYRRDELLGQPIEILLPDRFRGEHVHHRQSYQSAPARREMGKGRYLSARCKDGTEFPTEISLSYIRTEQGLQVMAFITDISERLEKQQQIQEQNTALVKSNRELALARKQAEDATRLKSEFLATMSHELRTPLNAVIGYSDILIKGMVGSLSPQQQNFEERILQNAEHLLDLINDVLDLAKIEAGRTEILKAPFSPALLMADVHTKMQGLAEKKGIVFEIEIDKRLPQTLIGDQERLKQILINLVSNGIKFTDTGSVKAECRKLERDTWAISVIDTGIGIPSHAQEFIFDEFRQVDGSSERKHGGTGLGLAIVRNLAMMMGGNVKVKSRVGEGSAFTVTLPLVTELSVSDPLLNENGHETAAAAGGN